MKTNSQIEKIARESAKNGVKWVASISKYKEYHLYRVVREPVPHLAWYHAFKTFGDLADWTVKSNATNCISFIPYIS